MSASSPFLVAAAQMCSGLDRDKNLARAEELTAKAADQGAALIAFPEHMNILADGSRAIRDSAESVDGETISSLQRWAQTYRISIHCGSISIKTRSSRVLNSSFLISDRGKILGRYDKIHLYDATVDRDRTYHESKIVRPGSEVKAIKTPLGKLGLSICYDLRFPELYRLLSAQGAQILFIPSAFTYVTGKAHWDLLTRARAVENLSYVVAPAQAGLHECGRRTWGRTRIVGPWGDVLAEKQSGTGIITAKVDLEELREWRKSFPVLKHRKL